MLYYFRQFYVHTDKNGLLKDMLSLQEERLLFIKLQLLHRGEMLRAVQQHRFKCKLLQAYANILDTP